MLSAVITRLCPRREPGLSAVTALLAFVALIVALLALALAMGPAPLPVPGGQSYHLTLLMLGAAVGCTGAAVGVYLLERAIRIRQRYEQREEIDA